MRACPREAPSEALADLLAAALAGAGGAGAATRLMSVPRLDATVTEYVPALAVALVAVGVDGDLDGLEKASVCAPRTHPKVLTEAYMLSEFVDQGVALNFESGVDRWPTRLIYGCR